MRNKLANNLAYIASMKFLVASEKSRLMFILRLFIKCVYKKIASEKNEMSL